jgi:uncharacterized protein (DUF2141 family)
MRGILEKSAQLTLLALFLQLLSTAAPPPNTLTILVRTVSNSKGVVGVLVFNSAQGWPEENSRAFRAKDVPAHPGQVEIAIPDLPDGIYAVVVLHDENENRKLDRKWYGAPKEQWGMSNNPTVHASAPSFDQSRFALHSDKTIEVSLH